jgi:release factor glutamine methyltransferase
LAHALGTTPSALLHDPVSPIGATAFQALVARRAAREPLALILGSREFWSLDFAVSLATLIPRPASETLIEAALAVFAGRDPPHRVLDLGTGTGCLLAAALSEFPAAFGVGVDRSFAAVALAARNAAMLDLADRTVFVCGDWGSAVNGGFDLVVSNPPYIPTSQLDDLMPEVACFEPRTALDGGADGYSAYHQLLPDLARLLAPDGAAVLELGAGQAAMVSGLAGEAGFRSEPHRDLSGIERALVLRPSSP